MEVETSSTSRWTAGIIQIWIHASFIVGVFGNVFLLHATTFHRALRMDRMSVWIVQNLSLADLLHCVLVIGVVLVSSDAGGRWVFGQEFCKLIAVYHAVFLMMNYFLLCALSSNKLLRCLFPLRYMVATKRAKITISVTSVFLSTIPTFSKFTNIYITKSLRPEFEHGICISRPTTETRGELGAGGFLILLCLFNVLPCVILLATNIWLVAFASLKTTSTRGLNRRTILVSAIVTAFYISSVMPSFVLKLYNFESAHESISNPLSLAFYWSFVGVWINPIIHLASSTSLRDFVGGKLRIISRKLTTVFSNAEPAGSVLYLQRRNEQECNIRRRNARRRNVRRGNAGYADETVDFAMRQFYVTAQHPTGVV